MPTAASCAKVQCHTYRLWQIPPPWHGQSLLHGSPAAICYPALLQWPAPLAPLHAASIHQTAPAAIMLLYHQQALRTVHPSTANSARQWLPDLLPAAAPAPAVYRLHLGFLSAAPAAVYLHSLRTVSLLSISAACPHRRIVTAAARRPEFLCYVSAIGTPAAFAARPAMHVC